MKKRGFALVYLLLVTAVMLMLIGGLLELGHQQLFTSQIVAQSDRALYASRGGVAAGIAALEANPNWTAGFDHQALPGSSATYSIQFANDPTNPGPNDSVNNLAGAAPVATYRGPATLPAHSVLLVVSGQQGAYQKTEEVLIGGGSSVFNYYAMAGSGVVTMTGPVSVYGLDSVSSSTSVEAGIRSNSQGPGPKVSWSSSTDRAVVAGHITSSGSDPATVAIQFQGNYSVGPMLSQQAPFEMPHYNIPAIVQAQFTHPGPPLIPGGTGQLVLGPGTYYYSGSQVLAGDLVLQAGAHVYVDGDLSVQGSVSGSGLLAVTGNTSLHGSASIYTSDSSYVSLLSQGNVLLEGFNGSAYMTTLSQESAAGTLPGDTGQLATSWPIVQNAIANITALTTQAGDAGLTDAQDQAIDVNQAYIARWDEVSYTGVPVAQGSNANTTMNSVPTTGASAVFMRERLQNLQDLFRPSNRSSDDTFLGSGTLGINNYTNGTYGNGPTYDPFSSTVYGGLFDMYEGNVRTSVPGWAGNEPAYQQMCNTVNQFGYGNLGTAFFQGLVYTNGGVVAQSDLTVLGAMVADDNGSQSPATIGGVAVKPGDLNMLQGTHLTYVKSMFANGVSELASAGILTPLTWHVR
jgi:hypothetical protein